MRWFIGSQEELERLFNELARRDFAWAYMPVPKIRFDGATRIFLRDGSSILAAAPKD